MKKIIHTSVLIHLLCYSLGANNHPLPITNSKSSFKKSIHKNHETPSDKKNQSIYKAKFEYPDDFDINALVKVYYKGDKLPVKDASFIFSEDANANIFNILFTEAACPEFLPSCTPTAHVSHIKTQEGCKSRYFHLSRHNPRTSDDQSEWHIKEVTINKDSFKIPLDRTIIILMNLAHLACETKDIFKNNGQNLSKAIVSLPTIIIQHLLDRKEECATSDDASALAQLSTIDLNTIHANECHTSIEQRGATLIVYRKN